MAKKIFRLHEGGGSDQSGWFKSEMITSEQLDTIKTGGKEVATSIPTPFATFDLVKAAFKWVSENEIKGETAQHKLVSNALDVAQLFYSYPKFKDKVRIVSWKPNDRMKELSENGSYLQKRFMETIKLFWNQDSLSEKDAQRNRALYNFEKTDRLYFILSKETNTIIGATSPITLFVASPDVKKAAQYLDICIGSDTLFDNEFASLGEREDSFVEYMYVLAKQPNFSTLFPDVNAYLERVKDSLPREQQSKISNLTSSQLNEYPACMVLDNSNDTCEVLGIKLGVQRMDSKSVSLESDFMIKPDYEHAIMPLVLPQHPFSNKWTYTSKGVYWDGNTRTPYKNEDAPEDSILPVQNDPHYWLTLGNFLEDQIIKLPYEIDNSKFVTCGSKSHLLPLSPTFFKYFKAEDVAQYLKITERTGGNVEAELRIPVRAGDIVFKKNYSKADKNIVDMAVHLAVFPFVKSDTYKITHYIGLLDDRMDKKNDLNVNLFKAGEQQINNSAITRNPGHGGELISRYYKSDKQPDALAVTQGSTYGFVVPLMKPVTGHTSVNFAIDFGTTNTHIEYKYGSNDSKPLDFEPSNALWQSLFDRNTSKKNLDAADNELTFEREILPFEISKEAEVSFPLRSAIVYNKDVDFQDNTDIIRQVNNYLLLEMKAVPKYLDLSTHLKWSNYADTVDEKRVEKYLEFLISMAYYKTLQLGGNPEQSTITWFYPVSMDEGELGVFFKHWKEVYQRVFNCSDAKNINAIPESIAPYLYYKSKVEGLSLSIDIGGGSTDIAVFDEEDKDPKLISSVKFAGNAIFGDGYLSNEYKSNSDQNGYVRTFRNQAENAVKNDDEKGILRDILEARKSSEDFNSFLFSLETKKDSGFSYTRLLEKDKKLKLPIWVFYSALAYYSANLLKKRGIGIPRYVLLSGTASKTASILDGSSNLQNLAGLIQHIFEKVYGKEAEDTLRVKLTTQPKEVTCKGALKAGIQENITEPPVGFWIGGSNDDCWGKVLDRDKDAKITPKYGDLEESHKVQIEKSIRVFYQILDGYNEEYRMNAKYNISPEAYETFIKMRSSGIKDFLTRGIKAYNRSMSTKIEDTLFFYPLIGILNKLAYELSKNGAHDE